MKTLSLFILACFSLSAFAQTETPTYYYVTENSGIAYSIKTIASDTVFIATSEGSSEAAVTMGDNVTKLALKTPIKTETFVVRNEQQVHSITITTHMEFSSLSGKLKIRELGSIQFPDNKELKPESLTEEHELKQVLSKPVKLPVRSQDYIVLPTSSTEVFRAQLKDLKSGVGFVAQSQGTPATFSSFLINFDTTITQKLSNGFDSMKVRLSNGDTIEYFGLDKPGILNSYFVYGIYSSKADKQVKVFTSRIAKDANYIASSTNLITKELIAGTYIDDLNEAILEFKENGYLVISELKSKKAIVSLAWSAEGFGVRATRYVHKNDYGMLTESEILECAAKPDACEVLTSRMFLPLKIDDQGLSLMRTMYYHGGNDKSAPTVQSINLQVLRKAN